MPTIPNPSELLALSRSVKRPLEDRQWKQYQRYLSKHEAKYGNPPDEPPLSFEEFCAWLTKYDTVLSNSNSPS